MHSSVETIKKWRFLKHCLRTFLTGLRLQISQTISWITYYFAILLSQFFFFSNKKHHQDSPLNPYRYRQKFAVFV